MENKYNNLTILDENIYIDWKEWNYSKYKCDCWKIWYTRTYYIKSWHTKSCWCARIKARKDASIHNLSKTRIDRIYRWVKSRCENIKHKAYNNYWWKWIKCEWLEVKDFINDMYESYLKHCEVFWESQTTIDRIDNDRNYCKANCKWATRWEQNRNHSRNINITYEWKTMCVTDWANYLNIAAWTLRYQLFKSKNKKTIWQIIKETIYIS
jgi:hypothetical protein